MEMKIRTQSAYDLLTFRMIVAVLFVYISGAQVVLGATYYTAKTGSDNNSCIAAQSEATPKLTVNSGLSCLSSGDTLVIHAGSYGEQINTFSGSNLPNGSSWSTATTVKAATGETVWLIPPGGSTSIFIGSGRQYIIFDGLRLDNINTNPTINASSVEIKIDSGSHHIRFANGEIKNVYYAGIHLPGGTTDDGSCCDEVLNNVIHGVLGPTAPY